MLAVALTFANSGSDPLTISKAVFKAVRNAQRFLGEVCINQLSESLETLPLVGSPRPAISTL
jgi:hypothetical protein